MSIGASWIQAVDGRWYADPTWYDVTGGWFITAAGDGPSEVVVGANPLFLAPYRAGVALLLAGFTNARLGERLSPNGYRCFPPWGSATVLRRAAAFSILHWPKCTPIPQSHSGSRRDR